MTWGDVHACFLHTGMYLIMYVTTKHSFAIKRFIDWLISSNVTCVWWTRASLKCFACGYGMLKETVANQFGSLPMDCALALTKSQRAAVNDLDDYVSLNWLRKDVYTVCNPYYYSRGVCVHTVCNMYRKHAEASCLLTCRPELISKQF